MPLRIAWSLLLTAAGLIVVEAAGLGARLFPAAGTATRWLVAGGLAGALFLLLLLLLGVRRDPLALLAQRLERFPGQVPRGGGGYTGGPRPRSLAARAAESQGTRSEPSF